MAFLKKIFYLLISFQSIGANAEYSAFCVKFTGERFVNINTFLKDDTYFRISDDEKIFIVKSESQSGLQSLCTNGSRLVTSFTEHEVSEQITPNQYVHAGKYLKNPIMFQFQKEYKVITDYNRTAR